jgi:hypothetical protein
VYTHGGSGKTKTDRTSNSTAHGGAKASFESLAASDGGNSSTDTRSVDGYSAALAHSLKHF